MSDQTISGKVKIVAAATLLLAVGGIVWSKSGPTSVEGAAATRAELIPAISLLDLMDKRRGELPVENWHPPF